MVTGRTILATALALLLGACSPNEGDAPDSVGGDSSADGESGTAVGDEIADLQFIDCVGEAMNLHGFRDTVKAIWVTVHAGWCTPCFVQHSFLSGFYDEFSPDDVQILFVLGENAVAGSKTVGNEYCASLKEREGWSFPVLQDEGFAETWKFAKGRFPTQILIDRDMVIHALEFGWDPGWQADHFREMIQGLID